MDTYLGPQVYMTVLHSISLTTCITLFIYYKKIPYRQLGLKMIMILGISDFIFHIPQIPLLWCGRLSNPSTPDQIGLILVGAAFRFSIYWACNIAFFLYTLISNKNFCDPKRYVMNSLVVLVAVSLTLSALFVLPKDRMLSLILLSDAPSPLAIIVTVYFYLRSISILKRSDTLIGGSTKEIIRVLYRYAFVHMLSMGPMALYFTLAQITKWQNDVVDIIMITPFGLAGFTNAVVYFFGRAEMSTNHENSTQNIEIPQNEGPQGNHSKSLISASNMGLLSLSFI